MPRTTLQPAELFPSEPLGFSQVVISPPGTLVHISGQVALDANKQITAHGREAQTRDALKNVILAVEAAGGTMDDIQVLRIYLPNFESGKENEIIGRVLVETFGANAPASAWIGVQGLARPEYLVEIEATAVIPFSET